MRLPFLYRSYEFYILMTFFMQQKENHHVERCCRSRFCRQILNLLITRVQRDQAV